MFTNSASEMPLAKPWADGPFELISSSRIASVPGKFYSDSRYMAEEMVIVHNFLLRGLNSIYRQCINVEKSQKDVPDFVSYALQWAELIEEHHASEERDLFPAIEDKAGVPGLMGNNVEQHRAFHDGLDAYGRYLCAVRDGKEKYEGKKLKAIVDSFGAILQQHLSDEIETLLGLSKYEDKCDWGAFFKKLTAEIMAEADDPKLKTTKFPMAFCNHDTTFEKKVFAHWPPIPWFVKLMFRWWFMPVHKGWWRFASCDYTGKPQELPFA